MSARSGMTLIEVLVTVAIMGVIASVVTLAVRRIEQRPVGDPRAMIADSGAVAVRRARAITVHPVVRGRAMSATLNPDGSIVADSALAVDRLSGRQNAR